MTSRERGADEGRPPGVVHMRDGFGPVGKRHRAYCSCGVLHHPARQPGAGSRCAER